MQLEGTISGYADRCHRRLVYRRQRDRIIRSRGGKDQSIIRANQPQPGRHRSYAPAPEFKLNSFRCCNGDNHAVTRSHEKQILSRFILGRLIRSAQRLPKPKTRPIFKRYNIASEADITEVPQKLPYDAVLANGRDGGIGRRAGLRIQCRKACRFESCSRHQKIQGETIVSPFNLSDAHSDQVVRLLLNPPAGTRKASQNYCTCCNPW